MLASSITKVITTNFLPKNRTASSISAKVTMSEQTDRQADRRTDRQTNRNINDFVQTYNYCA